MTRGRLLLERAFDALENRPFLTENERNLEKEISYYLLSTNESTPLPFIRLTDEEILEIVGPYSDAVGGYTRKLFDTIQDKLEEKNRG